MYLPLFFVLIEIRISTSIYKQCIFLYKVKVIRIVILSRIFDSSDALKEFKFPADIIFCYFLLDTPQQTKVISNGQRVNKGPLHFLLFPPNEKLREKTVFSWKPPRTMPQSLLNKVIIHKSIGGLSINAPHNLMWIFSLF